MRGLRWAGEAFCMVREGSACEGVGLGVWARDDICV